MEPAIRPVHIRSRPKFCAMRPSGRPPGRARSASRIEQRPGVARHRHQERDRREEQERRGEQRRQPGREVEAAALADRAPRHRARAQPVVKGGALVPRHGRQQPHGLDPGANRRQVHRQHRSRWRASSALEHRQQRRDHRQEPHARKRNRDCDLQQRRRCRASRSGSTCAGAGPDQERAKRHPDRAEAELVGTARRCRCNCRAARRTGSRPAPGAGHRERQHGGARPAVGGRAAMASGPILTFPSLRRAPAMLELKTTSNYRFQWSLDLTFASRAAATWVANVKSAPLGADASAPRTARPRRPARRQRPSGE